MDLIVLCTTIILIAVAIVIIVSVVQLTPELNRQNLSFWSWLDLRWKPDLKDIY